MAKRSKFQADLLLRSRPPSAFDVLRESAGRLQQLQTFPPGILATIGVVFQEVLDEVDHVNAVKADEKTKKDLTIEEPK